MARQGLARRKASAVSANNVSEDFSIALLFCLFENGMASSIFEEDVLLPSLARSINKYFVEREIKINPKATEMKVFSRSIKGALESSRKLSPENTKILVSVFRIGRKRPGEFLFNLGVLKLNCLTIQQGGQKQFVLPGNISQTMRIKLYGLNDSLRVICKELAEVIKRNIQPS